MWLTAIGIVLLVAAVLAWTLSPRGAFAGTFGILFFLVFLLVGLLFTAAGITYVVRAR